MEKALGFRLIDSIKEIAEMEASKEELTTALYARNVEQKITVGIETLENNLKGQASIYGVNYENYAAKIDEIKNKYLSEINKLKEEYEFQFINLQLELRETLANQKIALVNAKKISDLKKEFMESEKYKEYLNMKSNLENNLKNSLEKEEYDRYYNLLNNLENPLSVYDSKKKAALKKFEDIDSLVKNCEAKLKYCMSETYQGIDNIIKSNVDNSLLVVKENPIVKLINKVVNIFSGKSKFESKIKNIENNISSLNIANTSNLEKIRNNTIELVAEIQLEKENLNSENAA